MADLKRDSPRSASEGEGSVATAQRTELFILGAGLSAAVNSQMPTLAATTSELERRNQKPRQVNGLEPNVEHWMTFLSQRQPWLSEADNLRNRAAFLDLAGNVHSLVQERTSISVSSPCPAWLSNLVQYWHAHTSRVVSLNYDTLVEKAAKQALNISCGQLYPPGLTDAGRRNQSRFAMERAETFSLLKLHGSANWYYSGSPSYEGETIYYVDVAGWRSAPDQNESDGLLAVTDKVPLLIPPTTDKGAFFAHEAIKAIWRRAAEGVQAASRVFIIGYSCPQTDLGMEFFLRRNHRAGGAGVEVVDLNPAAASRYQTIWPKTTGYSAGTTFSGPNSVSSFVAALIKGAV